MKQEKKQIVFIGSGIPDLITKIAIGLKEKGYETVFISLVKNQDTDFLNQGFDKLISFDAKFFKISLTNLPKIFLYGLKKSFKILKAFYKIKKLKPYVAIGIATPNWLCFLSRKYFKNSPFIYFPFDIRSFGYKDREEALSLGVPKFELNAEKYCFKSSDGIIHKGNEEELNFLNDKVLGEEIKIEYPSAYFFPPTLEDFFVPIKEEDKLSYKDKNIHIVHVGHAPVGKIWNGGMDLITSQKIYFHLYSKTANLTKEEEAERINKNMNFSNKFLCFHEPVPQRELSKEISKYDYGIYGYRTLSFERDAIDTGNKIASYLEAGLPIICPDSYKAVNKPLQKYNAGIIIKRSQLDELRKILKKNKQSKLGEGVLKARIELGMRKQIPKLERFFTKVIKHKEEKDRSEVS